MAMTRVYDDYYNKHLNLAKPQLDQALSENESIGTQQKTAVEDNYNYQISEAEKSYDDAYRENAIQKLVNERQVAENMANMGLTDSGLNRTQSTAVQLSYGNNKAKIDRQKQAQVDALAQQLAAQLSEIDVQTANNAISIKNSYYSQAATNATNEYNNDVTADATIEAAELEAKAKQEVARLENEVEMTKLRLEQYEIDTNAKTTQEKLRLENQQKIAELELEAAKLKMEQYKIDTDAATAKYKADRDYDASVYKTDSEADEKEEENKTASYSQVDSFKNSILSKEDFEIESTLVTRGKNGKHVNPGNGGYKLDGKTYNDYEGYVEAKLDSAYESGLINEGTYIYLLTEVYHIY